MTDFEIRYFLSDGSLALVYITAQATEMDAETQAKSKLEGYAQFEVREIKPALA
ncbi:MAG: hypothetical protein WDM89_10780 [Rhizomicrobium sp.]